MSITAPDNRISEYNPVSPTTTFPATFPVFDNADLEVYHNGNKRTDFTVVATYPEGISNDAKVVFAPGVIGNVKVVGSRQPRRGNRFSNGAPLPISVQNLALDVLAAESQERKRDTDRAVKVAVGAIPLTISGAIGEGRVLMKQGQSLVEGPDIVAASRDAEAASTLAGNANNAAQAALAAGLLYFKPAVPRSYTLVVGQADVPLDVGDAVSEVILNGVVLPSDDWTQTGSVLTLADVISDADIPADQSFAELIVKVGINSAGYNALDFRYLSIISNPEKNLVQRGVKMNGDPYYAALNTALWNEAADEVRYNYGQIYCPLGTAYFNEEFEPLIDTGTMIVGQGRGITRWIFTGPNPQGPRWNLGSLSYLGGIRDISILIEGASDKYGISFYRPADFNSSGFFSPVVENVEVKGIGVNSGFVGGLFIRNGWGARVSNFADTGRPGNSSSDLNGASIVIEGNTTAAVMQQIYSTHRDSGVFFVQGSFSEAPKIIQSEFVNVNDGIVGNSAIGAPEGASPPGMNIAMNHFATNKTALKGFFRPQLSIYDNLIYNRCAAFAVTETDPVKAAAFAAIADAFVGIYLDNGNQSQVLANTMLGFGRGAFFRSQTAIRTAVHHNILEDLAIGFDGNNTSKIAVDDNYLHAVATEYQGMTGSFAGTNRIW